MKTSPVALLALLIVLAGALVPGDAWAHGFGWWGPGVFFGGLALGAALAYPYYAPPYAYPYPYGYPYAYPYSGPLVYEQAPSPPAPQVQRDVCHPSGCYHLYGDGVSQPWQWVWTPAAPPPPPASR